jgi:predicted phage terminase large subunit-like protein
MKLPTLEEVSLELAKRQHLYFMDYLWRNIMEPFRIGQHTKVICERIDEAMSDFRQGKSTFLKIKVPFRHGKSDIISRFLPAKFIGEFPDNEVLVTTHSSSLVHGFSRFARALIKDPRYKHLYPKVKLSRELRNVEEWAVEGRLGKVQFVSMAGSVTGKGGALIILDDFFKSREEAESEKIREKRWEQFKNLLTRRAPVTIVIVLATPWHIDDIFGRIDKYMDEDENFPRFEEIKFPAIDKEKYYDGYLFSERYSPEWYESMTASLGAYDTSSLLQCEPNARENASFRTDKIRWVQEIPNDKKLTWVRAWDLASSTRQLIKSSPDYTVGALLAVDRIPTKIRGVTIPVLYIKDIVRGQWEATLRNKIILNTALADGDNVPVGIEAFGGYKDAFTEIRDILMGMRNVSKVLLPGDKLAKSSALLPAFQAGNVIIKDGVYKKDLVKELEQFPNGAHDDQIDAICVGYGMAKNVSIMRKE